MINKKDLLEQFGIGESKTIKIEAIDGEVKIKKLTVAQRSEVNKKLFKDADPVELAKGQVAIDMVNFNEAAKLGVSYGLVEPNLSLRDIENMSENALDFINETFNAIQEFDEPKK